jgi:2-amino-4-hydroxy-6-hydroxymethyldihydropteridine diphosphokinase
VSDAVTAYIALGANLGDRAANLQAAVDGLHRLAGVTVAAASPVYETRAHTLGSDPQPDYLNAVAAARVRITPEALLDACLRLEQRLGRTRAADARWAPRLIDLDLLLYGQVVRHVPGLHIPHPRLAERRFVLQPLYDLAPNLFVPAPFDATVAAMLDRCPDSDVPRRTAFILDVPRA